MSDLAVYLAGPYVARDTLRAYDWHAATVQLAALLISHERHTPQAMAS